MIVLGFDTSTRASAVGLLLADGRVLQARDDPADGERPGHATRLLPLAADLIDRAGLSWRDIERIGVGVGPGGFTGLRVGVASARGLAQSLDAELVGVSSLRALAVGALHGEASAGVLAAIDARRGEVFVGAYARVPAQEALDERLSPRPVTPQEFGELRDWLSAEDPGATTRWLAVGDGAVLYRTQLERAGIASAPEGAEVHKPSGAAICRLAAGAVPRSIDAVVPDYVRLPDAETALQRRQAEAAGAARS